MSAWGLALIMVIAVIALAVDRVWEGD